MNLSNSWGSRLVFSKSGKSDLLEIYDASTASYGKKVSSTYQRYACGTFLPYSLYLHRLFQKANGKWYFRTDKDVRGSMQKQVFCQKNLSLKSVHGSTLFNSLRVLFALRLVSGITIFKRLTEGLYTRMPLLKTILDVSERTRMSVKLNSSEIWAMHKSPMFFVKQKSKPF